jgi:hypothetical protein
LARLRWGAFPAELFGLIRRWEGSPAALDYTSLKSPAGRRLPLLFIWTRPRRAARCHWTFPYVVCQSCGKSFSEERKLRDHINNNVCGGRRECRFCGRTFDTQSGVRQHETKAHFNEYAAAASRDTKAEPGELLAAQLRALARAETEIGAFPSRLAVRLGWTVDMVKYRRRLAQYKALIGDEHDRTARELREDTLSPLESSGRPPAAAAPLSTPSAGPGSTGSRPEPLGPTSSPVMGSTSLSAPPMEGRPGRVAHFSSRRWIVGCCSSSYGLVDVELPAVIGRFPQSGGTGVSGGGCGQSPRLGVAGVDVGLCPGQ